MIKINRAVAVILAFAALLASCVYAHSGGTDIYGGHYDYDEGEYHYHHGYAAHKHDNGVCPYIVQEEAKEAEDILNSEFSAYDILTWILAAPIIIVELAFLVGLLISIAALLIYCGYVIYSFLREIPDAIRNRATLGMMVSYLRANSHGKIDKAAFYSEKKQSKARERRKRKVFRAVCKTDAIKNSWRAKWERKYYWIKKYSKIFRLKFQSDGCIVLIIILTYASGFAMVDLPRPLIITMFLYGAACCVLVSRRVLGIALLAVNSVAHFIMALVPAMCGNDYSRALAIIGVIYLAATLYTAAAQIVDYVYRRTICAQGYDLIQSIGAK